MNQKNAKTIENWLVQRLAEILKIDPGQIHLDESFSNFGLDSVSAVALSGDLEDWLETKLTTTLVFDYPTIALLAEHLAQKRASS